MTAAQRESSTTWTAVTAPARLHFGFVDLHGGLGRRFGSLGLALEWPITQVFLRRAARTTARGPDGERALRYAQRLLDQCKLNAGVEIVVAHAIPSHAGLGSGTQLALAVGMGLARVFDLDLDPPRIAVSLERGARSGIGVGAFLHGGFLVDGGLGARNRLPPVLCRLPMPAAWRIVLIFDDAYQGVHGDAERRAFAALPEFPAAGAGELCRLALVQLLPALAEGEIEPFGVALTELQRRVGDYFAPAQGGRFASSRVAEALDWCARQGAAGVGQSSWGPTGFALYPDAASAARECAEAQARFRGVGGLRFAVCQPRNRPGTVEQYASLPTGA